MAASIHPTAIVDASAELGDGVVVGPCAHVEADVVVGDHCQVGTGAVLRRYKIAASHIGNLVLI